MKCGEDESTKRNQCTVHERENKCQYQCGKMKDARKRRTEAPGLDEFWEYSAGPGYGKRIKQHCNVQFLQQIFRPMAEKRPAAQPPAQSASQPQPAHADTPQIAVLSFNSVQIEVDTLGPEMGVPERPEHHERTNSGIPSGPMSFLHAFETRCK